MGYRPTKRFNLEAVLVLLATIFISGKSETNCLDRPDYLNFDRD
jgi:hypothetical protein